MSLTNLMAYTIIAASIVLIVRESKNRGAQYLAIATLALGILQVLHARGRLFRFLTRLQEAGTALAFVTLLIGLILFVRVQDKTFPVLLVVAGAVLLLVDLDLLESLR
jgi:hypothetical protein